MNWRQAFFFLYLVCGFSLVIFVIIDLAIPGIASYSVLAAGKAKIRHIQIVSIKKTGGVHPWSVFWDTECTGGPLGRTTEKLSFDLTAEKFLRSRGIFHIGAWVPAVHLLSQWIPPPEAKLDAELGTPGTSLMALAGFGLLLRCVIGPRAFPSRYEAASINLGPNFTGVPTRRPLVIVLIFLLGFLLMIWQIFVKPSALIAPGQRIAYWFGIIDYTLFLLAVPVIFWAALPRLRRVQTP